ncbi:MAG: response regulator transcription factor [Erysipelotrichaceae bacterium]|nr:response regulator transcription factor [Erysipelotrichaceae bacterium]
MARLLIVDDEVRIREMIKKYAQFEGHEVDEASDGFTAIEKAENHDYDLIIMDVMMPELDGFSAVKAIRKFKKTPVIMLSARGEEYDRIHGFEVGVDDYVVKPFSVKELMMRIQAILSRRGTSGAAGSDIASFEGLTINYSARIVTVDGVRTDMSPKEYELLFYMSRNRNIALSREKLLTEVWGYDYYGDDRTLDTHIKLLRKSLGPYQKFIVTVRGVGYRFEVQ